MEGNCESKVPKDTSKRGQVVIIEGLCEFIRTMRINPRFSLGIIARYLRRFIAVFILF